METIANIVENVSNKVLDLANQICLNSFSNETLYVKADINELNNCKNFFEENKLKFKILTKGKLLTFEEIVKEIENNYDKLHWIDFLLYYTCKKCNVIIVVFVPKENMNNNDKVNFHYSIPTPLHLKSEEKFNLNWKHSSFLLKIKLWFWQQKISIKK